MDKDQQVQKIFEAAVEASKSPCCKKCKHGRFSTPFEIIGTCMVSAYITPPKMKTVRELEVCQYFKNRTIKEDNHGWKR